MKATKEQTEIEKKAPYPMHLTEETKQRLRVCKASRGFKNVEQTVSYLLDMAGVST